MQVKKIAALCALAFAGMASQQANAGGVMTGAQDAILNDAIANNRVVFISGASAVQKGFTSIVSGLFSSSFRMANTTASSRDFEAVAGPISAAAGGWAVGSNVIVIYRTKGGSVFGVDPVARPVGTGTAIETLKVTAADCGTSGAGTAASPYVCAVATAPDYKIPDAGISDVAPDLFKNPSNTEGETPAASLTPAELAEFNAPGFKGPIYGLAFGVAVTNNVTVAMNRSVVAGIMSGNAGTWDIVDPTLAADDVVVCRRVPGSGTQAVFNLHFNNYPCGTSTSIVNRDDSSAWNDPTNTYTITPGTGALVVVENSTSGDVRNCLDKAVTGGTYATKDRNGAAVTVNFTAAGNKAIGVLSMDSIASSKTAGNWTFRSFDAVDGRMDCSGTCPATTAPTTTTASGNYPTLAKYVDGEWDLQGWISFNIPKRTTGNKRAFLNNFVNTAKAPATLQAHNDTKWVTAAIPGGAYSGAQVLRAEYLGGNQCAPYSRFYN
jgi:hypothetical protein